VRRVRLLASARDDLAAIGDYIQLQAEVAALRLVLSGSSTTIAAISGVCQEHSVVRGRTFSRILGPRRTAII